MFTPSSLPPSRSIFPPICQSLKSIHPSLCPTLHVAPASRSISFSASYPCILSSSNPSAGALLLVGGGRVGATVACSHGRGGGGGCAWSPPSSPSKPLPPPLVPSVLPFAASVAAVAPRRRFALPPRLCEVSQHGQTWLDFGWYFELVWRCVR